MSFHAVAFDFTERDLEQAGGARIAPQYPANLTPDLPAIGLLLTALQSASQPGPIIFDAFLKAIMHGLLLLPTGVAAAHDEGLFALLAPEESDLDIRLDPCR